jgi:hypothetical protein
MSESVSEVIPGRQLCAPLLAVGLACQHVPEAIILQSRMKKILKKQ